ncbi:hypothetical protein OG439_47670 [Amycolatopsis sp. NBC_01307]|uniref:hypothetical protein n=1 Tax=Amycolatopsis sp. NBC_01307 TaxID=2903561 RepID=UPI002E120AFB|nr:hypothetical protein OG439_47670 [Amycolatopsis sp. NBC_01307]
MGRLSSTAAFDTDKKDSPLTLDERKLVLFLLVSFADDRGSLAETRRRLIEAYGSREGHWCAGKTEDSLLHLLAKSIGQGATSPPPWERIVEIVDVAVPLARRGAVLGRAAALFARTVGRDRPVCGYEGPLSAPAWLEEPVVTIEMILADGEDGAPGFREGVPRGSGGPSDAAEGFDDQRRERPVEVRPADARRHPIDDPVALRKVLLATAKTASELADRVEVLNADLRSEQVANWRGRSENQRLRSLLEQSLREKCPRASIDTIRQLINEQLRPAVVSDLPSPRPLRG